MNIDRVKFEDIDEENFKKNYYDKNRPVVIEGALKDFKAVQKWKDPQYLCDKIGSRQVECDYTHGTIFTRHTTQTVTGKFDEIITKNFIEPMKRDPADNNCSSQKVPNFYVQQMSIYHALPSLLDDVQKPPLLKWDKDNFCNIWLGSGGMKGSRAYLFIFLLNSNIYIYI